MNYVKLLRSSVFWCNLTDLLSFFDLDQTTFDNENSRKQLVTWFKGKIKFTWGCVAPV